MCVVCKVVCLCGSDLRDKIVITKEPNVDRKQDGYEKIDLCCSCVFSTWGIYPVYQENDIYGYRKPKAFHLSKYCNEQYKGIRKIVKRCKLHFDPTKQTIFSDISLSLLKSERHRVTYQECVKEAMVKTEQISEFILPSMIKTHGAIIQLMPNDENELACGWVRDAKDTPFKRATVEFNVKFVKDGLKKKYTMNKTTFRRCADAFGDDSDKWLGKRIKLEVLAQMVRGEKRNVIYGTPIKK